MIVKPGALAAGAPMEVVPVLCELLPGQWMVVRTTAADHST
ncbi:hypothetical protein [Streptomyces sp. NPDC058155]